MKSCSTPHRMTLLSLVAAAGCCLSAISVEARQTAPAPALKGPEVKDRNVPGVSPDFGMTTANGKRRFTDRMPPVVFRKALEVLSAADAPAEIRATDAQRATFKSSVDGFEQQVREYRKSHASEIAELRKAAGESNAAGGNDNPKGRPGKGGPSEMAGSAEPMRELSPAEVKQREEAKAKLRELMEGAPKIEAVYTQVWTSLSEPQQRAVDAKLNEYKAEQAQKREDAYVRQRTAKKSPQQIDGTPAKPTEAPKPVRPAARAAGEMGKLTPELRERLMQFFAKLTPEEQAQLMSRLEERFKDRAPTNTAERGKARKQSKPAPNPDEVNVPSPNSKHD